MPQNAGSQFYTITESVLNFAVLFYRKARLILVNIWHRLILGENYYLEKRLHKTTQH